MRTFPSPSPAPPTAACRRRTACGSPQLVSTPRPRWPVLTRRRMAGFEVSIEGFYLETGFSKGHLSQILRGNRSPSLATIVRLAKALDVDVAEFFVSAPQRAKGGPSSRT